MLKSVCSALIRWRIYVYGDLASKFGFIVAGLKSCHTRKLTGEREHFCHSTIALINWKDQHSRLFIDQNA